MVPELTMTEPIWEARRQKLIFAAIVVLAIGVLGLGFARQIIAPLRALHAAANRLAAGDVSARVSLHRGDELGELATSFNAMAAEVASARQGLESQVAEQTAQLRRSNDSLQAEIAQRAALQASLQEREGALATTLDSIGDAVIATDRTGRVVRMNPVAEALTGWTRAEACGEPLDKVFAIVNEDTRQPVESPVEHVLRDGRIVGLANHTVLVSRRGTECAIADSAAPIRGPGGDIRGVVLVFRDVRAERDAQHALAASERKYRDLYEHSPDMYLTADLASARIVDCNQTLCERLGYTKDELLAQPFPFVYHASYLPEQRMAATQRLQETGEFVDVERTLRCKDGRTIPVSLNLCGVRDGAGRVTEARAVWRDISARKQAELDLQLLVRLGEVLQSSTDEADLLHAVCIEIAQHLRVARCSFVEIDRAADRATVHRDVHGELPSVAGTHSLTAFGRETAQDASNGATTVVADTASDPRTAPHYETAYRPVGVRACVTVPLLRNGEWVAALTVGGTEVRHWDDREVHLLKLVAERAWVWIEHLRVLTELRHRSVQEAIAKTEARFRILVEAIQDYAVFMLDAHGVVATWNAGAQRIQGYPADQILGRSIDVFYTPEDIARGHPQEVLERTRSDGRFEEEGWRMRSDGSRFWASVVVTAVRDPGGQLEGFAEVTRDVTERRRQEDELRARQVELTRHLKERDVLLQEIHHRVKNNLQVISSLINMQVRKLDNGASRTALEECQTRVLAIALIHEKLYQSKNYAEVQFADYARSLAANVFYTLGVARNDINLELAIDPIPLSIDRAIPCGLLINELITNALKHAFPDNRAGTVRVSLARAGDQLRLEVRDNGVGLPHSWNAYKANSIGLQLVVTLAEQLAGTLVVEGHDGASFQITFPQAP
jgi:PAS domain S-box-containing protein